MILHELLLAAKRHAEKTFPHESVGYVAGGQYLTLSNIGEKKDVEFLVPANEMLAAYDQGLEVFVHSHTDGMDWPSVEDIESQIDMDLPWGVVVLAPSKEDPKNPVFKDMFFFGDQVPIAPYANRPFRHYVQDCYSLVRDWYRQERGIALPHFPRRKEWWAGGKDQQNLIEENFERAGFSRVSQSDAQKGDVVLMSIGGHVVNHLGIYVGDGLLLHHLSGRLSRYDSVVSWTQHTAGRFVRYVGP